MSDTPKLPNTILEAIAALVAARGLTPIKVPSALNASPPSEGPLLRKREKGVFVELPNIAFVLTALEHNQEVEYTTLPDDRIDMPPHNEPDSGGWLQLDRTFYNARPRLNLFGARYATIRYRTRTP